MLDLKEALGRLQRWIICDYPDDNHSLFLVPPARTISLDKWSGGMSSTDTCGTTQRFHDLYKEKYGVYEGYCFNHIRDVWIGTVHQQVNSHIHKKLEQSFKEFPSRNRVSTNIKDVIFSVHKEFSLVANYAKGHGQIFRDWFIKNHAGEFLFTTERSDGSRQDIVAIGAIGIYYNRNVYLEFLDERMTLMKLIKPDKGTNILQSCLFSELACLEHIQDHDCFRYCIYQLFFRSDG